MISTSKRIVVHEQLVLYKKNAKFGYVAPSYNDVYKCLKCDTMYPKINGHIMCNGEIIEKCPFCRSDSKPWKYGRGA